MTQPDNRQWREGPGGTSSCTMEEKEEGVKYEGLKRTQEEFCALLDYTFDCGSEGLAIRHVDLSESMCQLIGKRLGSANCSLSNLELTYCQMNDAKLKFISESFKVNTTLNALDLSDNSISKEGTMHLYKVMPSEPTLKSLDLSDNPCIGEGIRLLENIIEDFIYTMTEHD